MWRSPVSTRPCPATCDPSPLPITSVRLAPRSAARYAPSLPVTTRCSYAQASVETVADALGDAGFGVGDLNARNLIREDRAEAGEAVGRRPARLIPQAGADEGLAAMEVDELNRDIEHAAGRDPADREPRPDGVVHHELRTAVGAQRMGDPRHEEEQPDPAVLDNVPEAVQPVVAGPVRQEQPALAFDGDEARRVAAWRRLRPAVLARGRHHHEL